MQREVGARRARAREAHAAEADAARARASADAVGRAAVADRAALVDAALDGSKGEVLRLLKQGVSVNCQDDAGRTPLMVAAQESHVEILHDYGPQVNLANNSGLTPQYKAAAKGHVKMMRELLDCGANRNLANDAGNKPIDVVCVH